MKELAGANANEIMNGHGSRSTGGLHLFMVSAIDGYHDFTKCYLQYNQNDA